MLTLIVNLYFYIVIYYFIKCKYYKHHSKEIIISFGGAISVHK